MSESKSLKYFLTITAGVAAGILASDAICTIVDKYLSNRGVANLEDDRSNDGNMETIESSDSNTDRTVSTPGDSKPTINYGALQTIKSKAYSDGFGAGYASGYSHGYNSGRAELRPCHEAPEED